MSKTLRGGLAIGGMLLVVGLLVAQTKSPVRRARPPKFEQDVLGIFSGDARDRLKGPRPQAGSGAANVASGRNPANGSTPPPAAGDHGWSKIVSADVLETEVKRISAQLATDVTTPSKYAAGGYQEGRRHFTMLAAIFGVIAEYDGNVRWKRNAAGLRDAFARAARNSKVGSQAAYNEAVERKTDLEDLIRGGSPSVAEAEPSIPWNQIVDRSPLMKRLDQAFLKRLKGWAANAGEFKSNQSDAAHEAQIIAMLAEILTRAKMPDYEDEEYTQIARQMKSAALTISAAASGGHYDQALPATGNISKSCTQCHDAYR